MTERKNQLHAVLAVEDEARKASDKVIEETMDLFKSKSDFFDGVRKVYEPRIEEGEQLPPETKKMVTTVGEKLNYAREAIIRFLNITLTKDQTNASTEAVSEIKIGNDTFNFSGTTLLTLAKHLRRIRDIYNAIPTLDSLKDWEIDEVERKGV